MTKLDASKHPVELSDSELQTVIGGMVALPPDRPPIIVLGPIVTCPQPTPRPRPKLF
jgi:bacteriocin-like protein